MFPCPETLSLSGGTLLRRRPKPDPNINTPADLGHTDEYSDTYGNGGFDTNGEP